MTIKTSYYYSSIPKTTAMGLRQLVPVVILIIQLFKVEVEAVSLPRLRDNRLFEGTATNLPGNHAQLDCGPTAHRNANMGARKTISQALTSSNFGRYAFTSGALGNFRSPRVQGIEGRFKFTIVSGSKTMYALNVDPTGEPAYWLPQGGVIDVPHHPNANQPKYVFSADFSGCSWTVTPMNNGNLRLRHVTGGQENQQFNSKSTAEKGGDITYAMQYVDYGYTYINPVLENRRGFAYMHYTGGNWQFHFQRQTCIAWPGGYEFKNGLLSGMKLTDNRARDQISSVKTYSIP